MAEDTRPIVIKRVKKVQGGAHGGAWKLAYADFVTAMMAFFILMWLLGSTAKGDLQGIADFFRNPLKISKVENPTRPGTDDSSKPKIFTGSDRPIPLSRIEARREFERRERMDLERLKQRIEELINDSPQLLQFKNQLLLDITSEGLRIQIIDEMNRPMFDLSSDRLKPYTQEILQQIAPVLNEVPNRISLAGHTDAAQYATGDSSFSNWELSANRANASRRELMVGGLKPLKVLRVVGLSSSVLYDPNDPFSPTNRRISIIVLNKRTEVGILEERYEYDIGIENEEDLQNAIAPTATTP